MAMLRRIHWLASVQFGLNFLLFLRSIKGIPRYIRDLKKFRGQYTGKLRLVPCLHDWHDEGGSTKNEYFWQDLLVARKIFSNVPKKHVDIGSRVDGFVAHIASFREIEVFDVRPISTEVPGILFRQADLMKLSPEFENYCDSLSCLHALEHFGLGRYGDPIDPNGYRYGLANMARLLQEGGLLYLSVPVGIERVEFNANRVFDPNRLISIAKENALELLGFQVISQGACLRDVELTFENLVQISRLEYALGIFTFIKSENKR